MSLCSCGREPRAICPRCGQWARVKGDKFAVHEAAECKGSHMEYGTCKESDRPVKK